MVERSQPEVFSEHKAAALQQFETVVRRGRTFSWHGGAFARVAVPLIFGGHPMRRSGIGHTLLKKLSAAVMAIALLLFAAALLIPGARLTASAESLYIRKIVSVVYDDSGSMLG